MKEEVDKQNQRMAVFELQNKNLSDEVKFLKSNLNTCQNTINPEMDETELEDTILNTISKNSNDLLSMLTGRKQKAARLIPASLLYEKQIR